MGKYIYDKFIKNNIAPKEAHHIAIINSEGAVVDEIELNKLSNRNGTPLYKFGLLSDIHVDTTDYNYSQYLSAYPYSDEGEGDFRRALQWLKNNEHVDMVCACGDMSQNGTTNEYAMPQSVIASELPPSDNIPFYTCTGNHDTKTAGGDGFGNYFLRSLEKTWNGMENFERSSAFNESFCFDIVKNGKRDHFIFFSMYSYSIGDSGNPYKTSDITWLRNKLESFKFERTFVFTHLFFRELAGNLGRINGSGGIYPSGNWLGGSQYTTILGILQEYNNSIWFSGHSHWKWDLQKFQSNANVARSKWVLGNYVNDLGAWTVHVPSCALPIDSDYSSTTGDNGPSREEKPLESQGGVVDVYEDCIVIRAIDFNINTSQNGSTEHGYVGFDYVRYLPLGTYKIDTTLMTEYLKKENFEVNVNKGELSPDDYIEDLGNGYVAISFSGESTRGFWVKPLNMVDNVQPTLKVDYLKVYSGMHTTSGTEISLPSYVGFYNGTNYSGTERYQIVTGFPPSYTESESEGRLQFQTSSSYNGGAITIVMRCKLNY